jgi:nitroimidazol reductase NimA-like FMN-containing flavoprotein (pyridoxamine 5'-phosphate oxidase superfamily)
MTEQQHPTQTNTPLASRPHMPEGYGIPKNSEGMLAWSDIRTHLENARLYWVSTTRPDGRPHAVPIWGAWVDDTFYFEGSPDTRRGRNLAVNPAVVVHIERGDLAVIVEGFAEMVSSMDQTLFTRIADSFEQRYTYRPESSEGMYAVRPRVVLAWDTFPTSATRWRFDSEAR